MNKKELLGK